MKYLSTVNLLPRCLKSVNRFYSADMAALLGVRRVKIPEGKNRYMLFLVYNHGYTGFGRTIVRGGDVDDHLEIFDQTLKEMTKKGICAKSLGGGKINLNKDKKKITIYGRSVNFGAADHRRTRNILQSAYKNFKITVG